jgi:hypothetical protein
MYLVSWIVFFAAYGIACYGYLQWLARRRVAALIDPSQFGIRQRILALVGSISLAVAPPLAELTVRIWEAKEFSDVVFLAFIGAWLISALPGIVASRKTLKAGGIDPDEES